MGHMGTRREGSVVRRAQMPRFCAAARHARLCAGRVGDSVTGRAWGLGRAWTHSPWSHGDSGGAIDSFWFSAAVSPAMIRD